MTSPAENSLSGHLDEDLLQRFREGSRPALARAISLAENLDTGFAPFLHAIHSQVGKARRIGITGPPGAGKSTLVAELTSLLRKRGNSVGIVAVDPTSPFSGGAVLGDRIRMNALSTDPDIFIRSMATRGSLGGLAIASLEAADLLDAFGFDVVLIETVGVGQSELEIATVADTTVVVLVPESGDSIQAMKAGLMEIADLFVVNKADRPGADRLVTELEVMLHLRSGENPSVFSRRPGLPQGPAGPAPENAVPPTKISGGWAVPVLKAESLTGTGMKALLAHLDGHAEFLKTSGELRARRRKREANRTRGVVDRDLRLRAWKTGPGEQLLAEGLDALEAGTESPYSLAARIVQNLRSPI